MVRNHGKTAIVYKNRNYSYKELLQHAGHYADYFKAERKPSKILIYAENSPEWIFAFYGTLKCEAIAIPVDIQSTPKELSYIISDCRPDIIFTSAEKRDVVTKTTESISGFQGEVVTPDNIDISGVASADVVEIPILEDDKTMLIIYTSGTTGSPKGVMQSYKNITFVADTVSKDIKIFKQDSNTMVLLPLHHSFPLMGSLIIPMYTGSTIHLAEGLNSESILQTLNDGKVSLIIGVPRLYDTLAKGIMTKINASPITRLIYKLAKVVGSDSFSKTIFKSVHEKFGGHIEYLVSGGAALSDETAEIFKTLGFYVLEGYGMTEASPMISFTQPGKRKIGYVGDPLKGMEIKIEPAGEVCIKGPNVMQGYYNRPEETAQVVRNGWLHTGDIGLLDGHGLKLTGRIKDIIVTPNGKNINPEEIEAEVLRAGRFIKEVAVFMSNGILQAVVFPDMKEIRQQSVEKLEELIREEIETFNKETSPAKRIKRINIISEELPKTRLGKIQRFRLPTLVQEQKEQKQEAEAVESQSKVYRQLKAFIEEETGYIAGANDHFEIDLSMDSLSRVSLLSYVESSFGLSLNESELESLNTLAKLTTHVENHSSEINDNHVSWKETLYSKIPNFKIPRPGFILELTNGISKVALHTTYRFKVEGKENIPDEPCIIVANHRSGLDGLIITARMKRKTMQNTFFFAKEKHWRTKFTRFMAGKNNVIIMDINKNVRESLQQMSYVLRQGKNVIIFPEGTRSKDKELKQFKETFAILSKELNIPVLPVAINGSEKAMTSVKFPRFFSPIRVNFLKPIYPSAELSIRNIRDRVMSIIQQALNAV